MMPPTNLQRLAFWSLAIGMATHGFAQPVINIPSLNQLPKPLRQAAKAQVRKEAPKPPIYSKLQRKWIVRNVERDVLDGPQNQLRAEHLAAQAVVDREAFRGDVRRVVHESCTRKQEAA